MQISISRALLLHTAAVQLRWSDLTCVQVEHLCCCGGELKLDYMEHTKSSYGERGGQPLSWCPR